MKVFLVGGAVRDLILEKEINDRDFVVVGSSPEELLSKGFVSVGNHFPVFLHPETREEYALARQEISTGISASEFKFKIQDVSLEEDLLRRDLTINAMAQDENGNIIDPFNGLTDLKNKVIRHVSIAFKEDPLRIFRVARFASQLNFNVAQETMKLMQEMVGDGLTKNIPIERIKKEFDKALLSNDFQRFLDILFKVGLIDELKQHFNIKHFDNLNFKPDDNFSARIFKIILRNNCLVFKNNSIIGKKLFDFQDLIILLLKKFKNNSNFTAKNIIEFHGNSVLKLLIKEFKLTDTKLIKILNKLNVFFDVINSSLKTISIKNLSKEEILHEKELSIHQFFKKMGENT